MILIVAFLAAIISPTMFIPGSILLIGGLAGIESDKKPYMIIMVSIGLVFMLKSFT